MSFGGAMHEPVLLTEVITAAAGARRIVDCTVGDAGHALALASAGAELLAIDRDPVALGRAGDRLMGASVHLLRGAFDDPVVLENIHRFSPDFILADLGVSSRQLDQDSLGFSFRPGSALDMRMEGAGPTAADLLNTLLVDDLAVIFREYGDEPRARRLAREICRRRVRSPFATSDDLVNAVRAVLGPRSGPEEFARLFQAVRIAVNDELERLRRALPTLRDALVPGGALAVISYHSGEDRIVKHLCREWARACICPPDFPVCRCRGRPLGTVTGRQPIRPTDAEVAANPRARSARLRIFRKAGP
jgi:16S rRNA (cytosine1402-N4)-methyltransferase